MQKNQIGFPHTMKNNMERINNRLKCKSNKSANMRIVYDVGSGNYWVVVGEGDEWEDKR